MWCAAGRPGRKIKRTWCGSQRVLAGPGAAGVVCTAGRSQLTGKIVRHIIPAGLLCLRPFCPGFCDHCRREAHPRSGLRSPTSCGGAVSIGNFDGVHLGHARIVERLKAQARQVGGPALVFTFDPHPVRLLRPELAPPPLTWTDRKAALLGALGVDAVIAYPTDKALLELLPEEFFAAIVRRSLAARALVEGTNFFFGHDRRGTIDVLRRLALAAHVALEVVEPVVVGGETVSSSRVRKLVAAGDVADARRLLTEPYRIRGQVARGAGRGSQLGFPTANLEQVETLLPALGVYAGRGFLDGQHLAGCDSRGRESHFRRAGSQGQSAT